MLTGCHRSMSVQYCRRVRRNTRFASFSWAASRAARWVIGVSLGLRQGETLGLQWNDVDLPGGILHVRRALQRQPGGQLTPVRTKTLRSNRSLPLPRPVTLALERH